MELRTDLVTKGFEPNLFLCQVDVESDTLESQPNKIYRRKVVGTIKRRGECFAEFYTLLTTGQRIPTNKTTLPATHDGKTFYPVHNLWGMLAVDNDQYPLPYMHVDEGRITLLLAEPFDGPDTELRLRIAGRKKTGPRNIIV
jgi:hypothetical protein